MSRGIGLGSPRSRTGDSAGPVCPRPNPRRPKRLRTRLARILAYGVLPASALLLSGAAGYLKWVDGAAREADVARAESVQAAIDSTVAMLSYRPSGAGSGTRKMTQIWDECLMTLTETIYIVAGQGTAR